MSENVYGNTAGSRAGIADTTIAVGTVQHIHRRISWAAIFAGVSIAIVVQILLSTLGAGIGLGTVNLNAGSTPDAGAFGIGAGIWWVVSSCIALFLGGYVAAWLAGVEIRFDGALHGLVAWGIATILTIYLLSSALGAIIGGGFSVLGSLASAAGSGVQAAAKPLAQAAGLTPELVQEQVQGYLQPTDPNPATMSPEDAQKEVARNLITYARGGPGAPAAKSRIIAIMAAQMQISEAEATRRFDEVEARLRQEREEAVQTAKEAADASAAAASAASFAAFGALLLGAIAAAIGGAVAVQRRFTSDALPG